MTVKFLQGGRKIDKEGGRKELQLTLEQGGVEGSDPPHSPNSAYNLYLALRIHSSSVSMAPHLRRKPLFSIFKKSA